MKEHPYDTSRDPGREKVLPSPPPEHTPQPLWQPFPGFSFLFDNPGQSLKKEVGSDRIHVDENALRTINLYSKISDAMETIKPSELAKRFDFFALPSSTYHVTVWDGVNRGNRHSLSDKGKMIFHQCFSQGIASAVKDWPPFGSLGYTRRFEGIGPVRLQYLGLQVRGNTVLVVELRPDLDDKDSVKALKEIQERRASLDGDFATYGKPENDTLIPHVAVGYFADTTKARNAMNQCMTDWMSVFDSKVRGSQIEFSTIGLYGFTDMVTYFKPSV